MPQTQTILSHLSDFKNVAVTKKQEAETMIQEFMNIKENAKPNFCHCYLEEVYIIMILITG